MLDPPLPGQRERFGFSWDSCHGFGAHHDFWSFYQRVVEAAPPDSTIVEVGCFHGRSLISLGLFAREANKGLTIIGVDNNSIGASESCRANIAASGAPVQLIHGDSVQIARSMADQSCWLVFIDGEHLHDSVAADIKAWMPKVRGWLSGHDFFMYTVHEPVCALFGDRVIYDERWQDIWIVPKCEPVADVNIRTQIGVMPEWTPGGWQP